MGRGYFFLAGVTSFGKVLLVVGSFGFLWAVVGSSEQVLLPKGKFLSSPWAGNVFRGALHG